MTTLEDLTSTRREELRKKFLELDILEACSPAFMHEALGWDDSWKKAYRGLWKRIRANLETIKHTRKMGEAIGRFENDQFVFDEAIGRKTSNTRSAFLGLLQQFEVQAFFDDQSPSPLSQTAKDLLEELKEAKAKK